LGFSVILRRLDGMPFEAALNLDRITTARALLAEWRDGLGDPVAYLKLLAATVPRELVVAREKESNVDMENLSFPEFMGLADQLKREKQFEWL
jgi:hypothetical protein